MHNNNSDNNINNISAENQTGLNANNENSIKL